MKLYRTPDGVFHGRRGDRKDATIVEVDTNAEGIAKAINQFVEEAVIACGQVPYAEDHFTTVVERQDPPMDATPSRPLQDLQEAFDAAPLQLQGELAVRAIDRMVAAHKVLGAGVGIVKQPDPMVAEPVAGEPVSSTDDLDDEMFG